MSELAVDITKLQENLDLKEAKLLASEQIVADQTQQLSEIEQLYERAREQIDQMQDTDTGSDGEAHLGVDGQTTDGSASGTAEAQIHHLKEEATAMRGREEEARHTQLMTEKARLEAQRHIRQLEQRIQTAEQIISDQESKSTEMATNLQAAQTRAELEHTSMLEEKQRAAQLGLQLEDMESQLQLVNDDGESHRAVPSPGGSGGASNTGTTDAESRLELSSGNAEYRSLLDDIATPSPRRVKQVAEPTGATKTSSATSASNASDPRSASKTSSATSASLRPAHAKVENLARECSELKAALQMATEARDAARRERDRRQIQQERRELMGSRKQAELLSQLQQARRDHSQLTHTCEQLRAQIRQQQAGWQAGLRQQAGELHQARRTIASLSQAQIAGTGERILSMVADNSNWSDRLLMQPSNHSEAARPVDLRGATGQPGESEDAALSAKYVGSAASVRRDASAAWRDALLHTATTAMQDSPSLPAQPSSVQAAPRQWGRQPAPATSVAATSVATGVKSVRRPGWGLLGRRVISLRRVPADSGPAVVLTYKVLDKATLRRGFDRASESVGVLLPGELVTVVEARKNAEGQTRLRCQWNGELYWTSMVAADGIALLQKVQERAPRSPLGSTRSLDRGIVKEVKVPRSAPKVSRLAVSIAEPPPPPAPTGRKSPPASASQPASPLAQPTAIIPASVSMPNLAAKQHLPRRPSPPATALQPPPAPPPRLDGQLAQGGLQRPPCGVPGAVLLPRALSVGAGLPGGFVPSFGAGADFRQPVQQHSGWPQHMQQRPQMQMQQQQLQQLPQQQQLQMQMLQANAAPRAAPAQVPANQSLDDLISL